MPDPVLLEAHVSETEPTLAEANVARLHELLELRKVAVDESTRESDHFIGPSQYKPDGRVFGGQVLAQCIVAAAATLPADRLIHSLHGYFLRAGDVAEPIEFGVERLRDGRSFSARRVHAYQKDVPILSLIASFQDEQPGFEHSEPMPAGIPGPEDSPDLRELLAADDSLRVTEWFNRRPFDIRPVEPFGVPGAGDVDSELPEQHVWFRASAHFGDDPVLNAAALAYASDFNLLEPVLRKHDLTWATPGLRVASLDHAMWWHRRVHVDDWMLYVQESPAARGGRGLGYGRIFSRDGELLATVAQEGMVRVKDMP
ncbi:acyl-CoA thioesterase II [Brevibacterium sp. XM4083]|uniref:acyl-CoA thioesterase n=1 Tax=Brevibacterium sp. XM4083 TaxID=2583238 RepID=UPI00112B09BD|nr:acyl-CoA thioesterase II [Brevibacterium sp. XM4083]MCM1012194.1 acyl-CoA thioesterase II [Brevibacterium sp. XM4083]